ncbi:MAG: hypothetical protein ACKOXB_00025 [Flavobacteriales bacterium]
MVIYSYLIEHDLGLAPNPFGRYCTIAVCKPEIRRSKKLAIGDWLIGTGSKALEHATGRKLTDKLIYAMKVTEKITLEQYWDDPRFQYKKPVMNGALVTMYGDNFYHRDESGKWIQEDSAHCKLDGTCHQEHLEKDTGGDNVLISEHFYYFGDQAPKIPNELSEVCHTTQGQKKITDQLALNTVTWIEQNFKLGINGDPLNWIEYNQTRLF